MISSAAHDHAVPPIFYVMNSDRIGRADAEIADRHGGSVHLIAAFAQAMLIRVCGVNSCRVRRAEDEIASRIGRCTKSLLDIDHEVFD